MIQFVLNIINFEYKSLSAANDLVCMNRNYDHLTHFKDFAFQL